MSRSAEWQALLAAHGSQAVSKPRLPVPGVATPPAAPLKKSLRATERNDKQRQKFRKLVRVLSDLRKCIFLDEMGSHLAFTRRDGRAAPGARVHDAVPWRSDDIPRSQLEML